MIKLIAFDWNGTILDDTKATLIANNYAFKKSGLKKITLSQYQNTFQIPIFSYWKRLKYSNKAIKEYLSVVQKNYHKRYEQLEKTCAARDGVLESLKWLDENGIASIIYSNHATTHIRKHLKKLKLNKLIQKIIARKLNDNSHNLKRTKGEKLFLFTKQKKLKPHEVVSIGDTEEEIEIAKQFGYYSVGITGGWNSTQRLKKHHPDFLIHNMLELKKIIKKLNK